jgi:hypothetical protein
MRAKNIAEGCASGSHGCGCGCGGGHGCRGGDHTNTRCKQGAKGGPADLFTLRTEVNGISEGGIILCPWNDNNKEWQTRVHLRGAAATETALTQ